MGTPADERRDDAPRSGHYWMPFTDNRRFRKEPRMVEAARDCHFVTDDGREVFDGMSTLWCTNAGHCRPLIVERIARQAATLDFASSFSMGHPIAFSLAERIAALAPEGFEQVFFTNSGSEAVDTALKIALAWHRLRGEGQRCRFVGRERGYHGVNLAGLSVSGLAANRKAFATALLPHVDHLRHTQELGRSAFSRGQPAQGAELADELENRIIARHDASTIAAVIVEPVSGAGGVLIPPRGYLERLREICTRHGIVLIFDEVISGFGRLGAPFAAQYFDVKPDLITFAKAVTSGAAPLGGVLVRRELHDTFMQASPAGIEFFHGYTYSGHPLACAAAHGALDTYEREGLFDRAAALAPAFEDGLHVLRDCADVVDCRNLGLIGAIEFAPRPGAPGARAAEAARRAWDLGVFVRPIGDALAFCPPLIASREQLDRMFATVREAIGQVA